MSHAWSLSLRCDRPIQGCEITSHASLSVKGQMENTVRANILRDNAHYFDVKWQRGLAERMCANDNCDRARTCNPIMWSKSAGTQIVQYAGDRHEFDSFIDELLYNSEDSYLSQRLFYLQNRRTELGGGKVQVENIEDPFADDF